jgi:hypothetical protein
MKVFQLHNSIMQTLFDNNAQYSEKFFFLKPYKKLWENDFKGEELYSFPEEFAPKELPFIKIETCPLTFCDDLCDAAICIHHFENGNFLLNFFHDLNGDLTEITPLESYKITKEQLLNFLMTVNKLQEKSFYLTVEEGIFE